MTSSPLPVPVVRDTSLLLLDGPTMPEGPALGLGSRGRTLPVALAGPLCATCMVRTPPASSPTLLAYRYPLPGRSASFSEGLPPLALRRRAGGGEYRPGRNFPGRACGS